MIEILKVMEKCKIHSNKGSQGGSRTRHLTKKNFPGDQDLTTFKNLPRSCPGVGDA